MEANTQLKEWLTNYPKRAKLKLAILLNDHSVLGC